MCIPAVCPQGLTVGDHDPLGMSGGAQVNMMSETVSELTVSIRAVACSGGIAAPPTSVHRFLSDSARRHPRRVRHRLAARNTAPQHAVE
jgi:hypothetical protein